jgi:anti-sigma factor RsiW
MNHQPSEEDIHAYVDGRLDDERRQAVEFYLAQSPQRAAEVRAWQRDAQELRAALGPWMPEADNPALDPSALRVRRRQTRRARLAIAAMLLLGIGLGGMGGWQAHAVRQADREAPMADAMQAYRMFAQQRGVVLDVTARSDGDLQAWLDTHFQHAPLLPDLKAAGFHPVGGRLLALSEGAAAMVLYENAQGGAISFYIRPPSRLGLLPSGQRQDGELVAVYGAGHGYNVAMVSRADERDMRAAKGALQSAI